MPVNPVKKRFGNRLTYLIDLSDAKETVYKVMGPVIGADKCWALREWNGHKFRIVHENDMDEGGLRFVSPGHRGWVWAGADGSDENMILRRYK